VSALEIPRMMLPWLELEYIVAMLAWLAVLAVWLRGMLLLRRRSAGGAGGPRWLRALLSVWAVLATLTALELFFALFVDQSDAFNQTMVSKRWFRRHVDAQRNDEGFRDRRELTLESPANVRRIFFFGDSFTIGHGIRRMEDRFTDRIEQQLNGGGAAERIQVFNLGEPGWDVSLIEGLMQSALQQDYQADMFVYVYMMNDIESYDPRTLEAIQSIQKDQPKFLLWTRTYFFNWMYFRWQQFQAGRTVDYFPHLADSYRSPAWQSVQASLQRMQQRCRAKDVEFRMVLFPFLHNLGPDYPFRSAHEQLRDFCRQQEIPVLDLEPLLTGKMDSGLTVNRFDNHPNELCHALAAQAIVNGLLSDLTVRD